MCAATNETPKNVATQQYECLSKYNAEVTRMTEPNLSTKPNQEIADKIQLPMVPFEK